MKAKILISSALIAFLFASAIRARAGSMNGVAGIMPAFYDGVLFNINFKELPPGGEAATLTHNGSINTIYMSDQAEAHGFTFGDGGPRPVFIDGLRRELEGMLVGYLMSTHLARGSRKPVHGDGVLIDTDNFTLNLVPLMSNATSAYHSDRWGG